ncbi:chymotrypsin-2 [Drosophila nasuta]|uniref:chymotrypsin-2 n=1 Tax=Drosophila nasuta TaxID=42062 RepID=UPI00295E5137|nr:chymotrypsin-2 [Drosophila nasuta]
MSYRLFFTTCIFMYYILRIESKVAYDKGSNSSSKSDIAKASVNDIDEPLENPRISKYPFMVSIERNDYKKYTHLCGGAILNEHFVITAAHCMLKPRQLYAKDISVLAGSSLLFDKNATRFFVKATKRHPQFVPFRGNDILLLLMEREIPIDNIHFGNIDFRDTTRKSGEIPAHLLGWGQTQLNQTKELEEVPFKTIQDKDCFINYRFRYLTNSEVCAMNTRGPRGACDGDSGGPLVDETHQKLIGLLTYGRKPCQIDKPYAFTRISLFVKWIEQEMANMLKLKAKAIK